MKTWPQNYAKEEAEEEMHIEIVNEIQRLLGLATDMGRYGMVLEDLGLKEE